MTFDGKTVVITGAAGGIGQALVAHFAAAGARVVAQDLQLGHDLRVSEAVEGDVTSHADWVRIVDAAATLGGIDVLVNNAGVEGVLAPITEYPDETFDMVMAVNARGVFLGMKHAVPSLRARGGGAIVNLSSIAGLGGAPHMVAYAASKHAVIAMTRTAALELAADGIRVNAVCPGPVDTRMMRSLEAGYSTDAPELVREEMVARIPMGRYADPAEVATAVAFLASDAASFISGAALPVDGAMAAR